MAPTPAAAASGVARFTVVGPAGAPDAALSGSAPQPPASERRSIERRLQDAAFVEAVDRGPGVLLVLAASNLLFAVWQGGLQQRLLVLLCAAGSLVWLLVCLQMQRRLLFGAVLHRTTLRRERRVWVRMMAVAVLTPALNLSVNLAVASRLEPELTVVLVLACLYAAAVWAALPALARVAAWSAGARRWCARGWAKCGWG